MADWGYGVDGVLSLSFKRHRICCPADWALKWPDSGACPVLCSFGAIATWAAPQASTGWGCALHGTALDGWAEYCSSKVPKNSALAERRNWLFLLGVPSDSLSSAFRRPRLGRHSGSSARRARSSSGGTPSRAFSGRGSFPPGLSV